MSYEKQDWEALPSEDTPVIAERMNHIEEGIAGVDTSKLDKMVVSKVLSTAGWYRVAKFDLRGSYIVDVNTMYNASNNMSATLVINIAHKKAKIALLNNMINTRVVSQVRVTQEGTNEFYLEIFYNTSAINGVHISILEQNGICTMLDFEAPTDTATVLDEITIAEMTITNSNGTATKLPDGTMICRKTIPKEGFLTDTSNSTAVQGITIYRSEAYDWNFPVPFVDTDIQISIDVHNSPSGSRVHIPRSNGHSKTSAQIQILGLESMISNGVGYNSLQNVYVTAIGRWK